MTMWPSSKLDVCGRTEKKVIVTTGLGWLRRFAGEANGRPALVVCPHAGGGASSYRGLATAAATTFDPIVLQYPGRQDRSTETPLETIPELAAAAFDEVADDFALDVGPVTVFGHSMGAIVAFELTRLLEADGIEVRLLMSSGAVSPARVVDVPDHPSDEEGLLAHLQALSGTGADLLDNEALMRMALPALRADYGAFDRYSVGRDVAVAAPIHTLGGDDDVHIAPADLFRWGDHTGSGHRVTMFPGAHFFLYDHFSSIAELLAADVPAPASVTNLAARTSLVGAS